MFNSLELIKIRLVNLNEPNTIRAISQTVINSIEEHKVFLKELGKPINENSMDINEISKIIRTQILEAASFRNPYDLFGISSFRIIEEYKKPKYRKILNSLRNEINNSSNLFQDFHYWFIMELNGILIGTLKCHLKYINLNNLKKINKDNNPSAFTIGDTIYDYSDSENKFKLYNDEIYLTDLYIHPNFRGLGFSKYLINTIISFIKLEVLTLLDKETNINLISEVLENNLPSQKVFTSLKFELIDKKDNIIKFNLNLNKDLINNINIRENFTSLENFRRDEENKILDLKYQSLKKIRQARCKMELRLARIDSIRNTPF